MTTEILPHLKQGFSISVEDLSWFGNVPREREGSCEGVSCFLYWPVAPIYDLTFP